MLLGVGLLRGTGILGMRAEARRESRVLAGLNAGNFRKISSNGFGDGHNCYPHSMAWFQDHLYAGTTRSNLALIKVAVDQGRLTNLAVWPVKTPANEYENDLRAQIWHEGPMGIRKVAYVFRRPDLRP